MWEKLNNEIKRRKWDGLNLQAWRIPLWVYLMVMVSSSSFLVSTSKPGESLCGSSACSACGPYGSYSLNLQAWRIPLWEILSPSCAAQRLTSQPPSLENPFVGELKENKIYGDVLWSQPPSLENPFVGSHYCIIHTFFTTTVSTSKPGESLCGLILPMVPSNPTVKGLNLQAWRIPLWVHL